MYKKCRHIAKTVCLINYGSIHYRNKGCKHENKGGGPHIPIV